MATLTLMSLAAVAAWYRYTRATGDVSQPKVSYQPPSTTLEALGLLARVANWSFTESVKGWRPQDLTLGLLTASRKEGKVREELRAIMLDEDAPCEVGMKEEWLDTLLLLLKLIAFSTKLARARKENSITKLCSELGIDTGNVLQWRLQSGMMRPAYLLLRDYGLKEIILIVRGTYSLKDTVTCLMGTTEPHHITHFMKGTSGTSGEDDVEVLVGHAHGGMLTAARWLFEQVATEILAAMQDNLGWGLRIVGHSLGGGTGFLLTTMLRSDARFREYDPRCIAFACPACVTSELALYATEFTTTIIVGEDVVPALCPYTIKSLRLEILKSQWLEELKESMGLGENAIFQMALSISNTAISNTAYASTALYSAARLTGKAVYTASNFTATVGRRLIAPLCSANIRSDLQPATNTNILLYRLPQPNTDSSDVDYFRTQHIDTINDSEESYQTTTDTSSMKHSDVADMVAPNPSQFTPSQSTSFHFEELDEQSLLLDSSSSDEIIKTEVCDALNISVSSEDLYSLAEASVTVSSFDAVDPDSKAFTSLLPVHEKRFHSSIDMEQQRPRPSEFKNPPDSDDDLKEQLRHVNEQLEIIGEKKNVSTRLLYTFSSSEWS